MMPFSVGEFDKKKRRKEFETSAFKEREPTKNHNININIKPAKNQWKAVTCFHNYAKSALLACFNAKAEKKMTPVPYVFIFQPLWLR